MDHESPVEDAAVPDSRWSFTGFFNRHGGLVTLAIALLSAGLAVYLGIWEWDRIKDGTTSATLRNLVLAAVLAPSAVVAIWRASVLQRQADTAMAQTKVAQQQTVVALDQAKTAHKSLVHQRFQEGIEMINSDSHLMRISGVLALRNLAKEEPRDLLAQTVEYLCYFARHAR